MLKKLFAIFFLCFFALFAYEQPSYAASASHLPRNVHMRSPLGEPSPLEVSSPWGEPKHGENHDHTHLGIDFASQNTHTGDPVYAVDSGTVITSSTSSDTGFDGWVVIEHAGGWRSWYGDMAQDWVAPLGKHVDKGDIIGHVGTRGGAHLHFEVRIGDNGGTGESLNPYLWARNAKPWLDPKQAVDPSAPVVAGAGDGDKSITWDAAVDFTGAVKAAIDTIAEACTKAIDLLKGIILATIVILATIDFSISMMLFSVGENSQQSGTPFFKLLIVKCFLYLLLFFAISHWAGYLANGTRDYFMGLGSGATGSDLEASKKLVADPFSIVTKGAKIVEPLFAIFADDAGFDFLEGLVGSFYAFCVFIIVFGSFILIAIQIAFAYLEFYFAVVFSFTTFMFAGWNRTRRWAENGLNGLFASVLKLLFFVVFANMMLGVVSNMQVSNLVIDEEKDGITVSAHTDGNFKSIEDIAHSIMLVESGGDYNIPSHDGRGFGAYQLSYQYFGGWYEETFGEGTFANFAPKMPYPEGDPRWINYGSDLKEYPYSQNYHEAGMEAPNPWPPAVQDKVALHLMKKYFNESGGSYRAVAERWNGDKSGAYWKKVCEASGTLHKSGHKLNMPVAVALVIYLIFFVLLADKMGSMIIQQFGGPGFRFTN